MLINPDGNRRYQYLLASIWRILDDIEDLKLVNPYFIKQLSGRKSDVRDTVWIAECTMKDLIRGSFVPSTIVQRMRQYNRRIFALDKFFSYLSE